MKSLKDENAEIKRQREMRSEGDDDEEEDEESEDP